MENDYTSSTSVYRNDFRICGNIANNHTYNRYKRIVKNREIKPMVENRKTRIKRLITEAHVRFVANQPTGSRLFWDLALNGIDSKTLYEEFANLELSQIIECHTKENKNEDNRS